MLSNSKLPLVLRPEVSICRTCQGVSTIRDRNVSLRSSHRSQLISFAFFGSWPTKCRSYGSLWLKMAGYVLYPVVALLAPILMPPSPNLLVLSVLLVLDTLPLLLPMCLMLLPSIEPRFLDCAAILRSLPPPIDNDVCSVEDEEGGETYFRLREVVGEKRRGDPFANGTCLAEPLFVSKLLSLMSPVVFDDRSSSG